ncbi:uncharacterized protein DUF1648 [Paenibacillus cellulosilyticus]|uniref:Uncharacterized protein DUF1648 n=1 Tax=Paenibacillus cellulosilyticus TaxID=375489 RepID=A0A2V2YVH8_9BACL|nr:DUF1648 domain-containing protein [Paenibacillus cellulosilyticus]PWW05227.1 uncharacterized protein DUF1648 [Paenibacillus cellulosilyticus]QKS43552.1 DUF1648 domain-containing protein [Paenibacillus cellulosilyticus]
MEKRPVIRVPRSALELWLEVVNIVVIVGTLIYLLVRWSDLPSTIPIHFDGSGEADGWGNRATLLLFPLITIAPYALITTLNRFPHTFNYPVAVTEQNASQLYRLTVQMLTWLKLELVLLFSAIGIMTIRSAETGRSEGVGILTITAIIIILGTVLSYLLYIIRRFRTPKTTIS